MGLLLAALILYWPAIRVFFSLDDLRFLLRAAGLEESPWALKRILSVQLYFKAAWTLFGTRPQLYHLVNVFLHAANAWLIYLIALKLKLKKAAIPSAILFLVSTTAFLPLHWISGIQELSMTFFALLTAYFYLGENCGSVFIAFVTAMLAVLCKEASLLVLPGLAITIEIPRKRRFILGAGGLILGASVLLLSGSLEPRPQGDPYETVFGINILWNLLTYNAWLIRLWGYFPDRIPQYQTGLALWGLILPLVLAIIVWRYPKARKPLGKASLLYFVLALPVLGLIRHSYLYYLYLPLVPFWILAGAALGRMSRERHALSILIIAVAFSVASGALHRRAEIKDGVPLDPILRYAAIARRGVSALGSSGQVPEGKVLFVRSFEGESVDLAEGLDGRTGTEHRKVHLFKVALLDGDALVLFFPRVESVHFEGPSGAVSGWPEMHIYGTYGVAEVIYLGFGEDGRKKFVSDLMTAEMYDRADREIGILLEYLPNRPSLLFIKGQVALKMNNLEKYYEVLEQLKIIIAGSEDIEEATKVHASLKRMKN